MKFYRVVKVVNRKKCNFFERNKNVYVTLKKKLMVFCYVKIKIAVLYENILNCTVF